MKTIYDVVSEGLFDDPSSITKNMEKTAIREWFNSWARGGFSVNPTKLGVKVRGDMNIVKFPEDQISVDLNIISVDGNISIEDCPNLKDLTNIFDKNCIITGKLAISNCPHLESLEGLPAEVQDYISISNCPNLKSIKDIQIKTPEIYCHRCGKKFKPDNGLNIINCSVEENEELITEAFQDAILKHTVDDLMLPLDMKYINRVLNIRFALDKVPSRCVSVYKDPTKPEVVKQARRIFSGNDVGVVFIYDKKQGKVNHVVGSNRLVAFIDTYRKRPDYGSVQASYIVELIEKAARVVIVNVTGVNELIINQLRADRIKSQAGVLNPGDEGQNQQIADLKNSRRKIAAAQLRAKKNLDLTGIARDVCEYLDTLKEVYMKLAEDPTKKSRINDDINKFVDGKYSILDTYSLLIFVANQVLSGGYHNSEKALNEYKTSLENILPSAKQYIRDILNKIK